MTEYEKMISGQMYDCSDSELRELRLLSRTFCDKINNTFDTQERTGIFKSFLGSTGEKLHIERSFQCDYGKNIHIGENFYSNFNLTILDCAEVVIGKNCMVAPNVAIYTATHPINPIDRVSGLEYAKKITIGNNCWIGGNAVICPGVTLGDNVVVGAGSVVTKSFGDNVVIAGNPAKIIKIIDL